MHPTQEYMTARVDEITAAISRGDGSYQQVLDAITVDGYPELAQWLAEEIVTQALAYGRGL